SSGKDMPGVVDRDVVFDDTGLPWLPGRRLKGLLRDAYSLVLDGIDGVTGADGLPGIDDLFGKIGQSEAGRLRVRNAFLVGHSGLRRWLEPLLVADDKDRDKHRPFW